MPKMINRTTGIHDETGVCKATGCRIASEDELNEAARKKDLEKIRLICSSDLYSYLRYGSGKGILELLFHQQITPGKAAEAIVEQHELRLSPSLPEMNKSKL